MSQNNNVIDGVQYCDHIRKENGVFVCSFVEELKRRNENIDIGEPIDVNLITPELKAAIAMTDEQAVWCAGELDYPNPEKPNHTPPRHYVQDKHPNCTFRIIEV